MKKILSIFAVAALAFAAVACGNKDAKSTDTNAGADTTKVEAAAEAAPAATGVMAQADAVAKKIKAGETITEDDFSVILDYNIAMLEEMQSTPEDKVGELLEKYSYVEIFYNPVNEWKAKAESLKPENKEKLVKYLKLDQN